jgi:tetratricopeptide (TPR) repeat protein
MGARDIRQSAQSDHSGLKRVAELPADYAPAVDEYATALIARIQRDRHDEQAVLALKHHYEVHRDYPSLANLMEGWGDNLRDDPRAAAAYVTAGDAVMSGTGDFDRARALFERALARYPESQEALARIDELLRATHDHAGLERVLCQLVATLQHRMAPAGLVAGVHYRLGELYEHRMMLPGRAIAAYRRAVELDHSLVPAIEAARRIYEDAGKHEAVADMYELEIAAVPDGDERHELLLALATHQRDFLQDLDAAVRAARRAIKLAPGRAETIELLAELLVERASRQPEGADEADLWRAAELYYQVARAVPRGKALAHLMTSLALCPHHERAQRMASELKGYRSIRDGQAGDGGPAEAEASQAEVDRRETGRFAPATASGERVTTPPPPAPGAEEIATWLGEEDLEPHQPPRGAEAMVPVTERPPAPAPTSGSGVSPLGDTLPGRFRATPPRRR